uniref:CobW C-terminal domain-containing protein n=1 Tax=Zooxanthella nutricula TaxID=1333877 RepID=A0A7S2VJE3_9DINO
MSEFRVDWSTAGVSTDIKPGVRRWFAAVMPKSDWPPYAEKYKQRRHGDRRTEIVFIGKNMWEKDVQAALESALLTPEEFARDFDKSLPPAVPPGGGVPRGGSRRRWRGEL